nr:PepSY domain-containing protein [Psychrobacter sp. PraFG1]UNK05437.1 PepSY domain-containing protein [Psychrobacter sp. PraFG1]
MVFKIFDVFKTFDAKMGQIRIIKIPMRGVEYLPCFATDPIELTAVIRQNIGISTHEPVKHSVKSPLHGLADTPANNPLNKPLAPLHTTAKPNINKPARGDGKNNKKYATIWRWHFYAGMFIAPFLLILSLSALGMLFMANTVGPNNELLTVSKQDTITPVSVQAHSALSAVPDGTLKQYIAPKSDHNVALFRVGSETGQTMVAVDPYSAKVIKIAPSDSNLYHTFDNIHSDLLIGKVGDYLLETAASLTTLLVLTGWYLWWYRRKSIKAMLIPDAKLNNKRSTFVTIHATLGTWLSVLLLLFCVSGMAWAGIWGGKVVQAWSQFPAGKWGNGPMPASTLPLPTARL